MICQIWDLPFNPEARLIARDLNLDIATFRITEAEVDTINKQIHRASQWPPSPPELSKGVFLIGYPGHEKRRSEDSIGWGIYPLLLTATSVHDDKIVCQLNREEWVNIFDGSEFSDFPPKQSLAGLSGAPLWTLVENPILSWRLAGIVSEFNENFELLDVRRPNRINPDGTFLPGS